ncbi:hypothetical protein SeMB42_g01699 [Synchytrium endobioticum]|uniref:Clp ATPase C-terminal domain-containing protein n=1 Tax=Synchytrium endobioticum TaxID=286115 RepID=A0A507DK44_9FUNG|nr:hypothetical protein SeMB42_g01699 [Synchytrium endobioticum]
MAITDPFTLWNNIKDVYNAASLARKPTIMKEWDELKFASHKTVADYNTAVNKLKADMTLVVVHSEIRFRHHEHDHGLVVGHLAVLFRLEELHKIVRNQARAVATRLAEHRILLRLSDSAVDYVLSESYSPLYGARPMKKYLEKHLVTQLSRMMLGGQLLDGCTVWVETKSENGDASDGLLFRVEGGIGNGVHMDVDVRM